MKNKGIKTLLWLLIAALWTGAQRLGLYIMEMQYASKVAPNQVDDDNAYAVLKTHNTANTVIDYVYLSGLIIITWMLIRVWTSNKKRTI
jgi:hypothetical protein